MQPLDDPRLDAASDHLDLADATLQRLRHATQRLEVAIPVRMDDGSTRTFTGYRVRHDDSRGPTKGGVRFHPQVDVDEVTALAYGMTLKTAVMDLPFGGGKGGIEVDVSELSTNELRRLTRGYIDAVADILGPDRDIPAPDVDTDPTVMAWISDAFDAINRGRFPAAVTGKPLAKGGSEGRSTATARGAFHVITTIVPDRLDEAEGATVAIQGFGNAGSHLARMLADEGYKVVAVSDSSVAVFDEDGLDVAKLAEHKTDTGSLEDPPVGEERDRDEVLTADVDILIPAALENAITTDNVDDVKATLLFEVANGPVAADADQTLADNGVEVVPDILVNAGGVTVSYLEWVQNRTGLQWSEDEVQDRLEERMLRETQAVRDLADELDTTLRVAAYVHALKRLDATVRASEAD